MMDEEKRYIEFLLRWLSAKRDFQGLDIGPEPECWLWLARTREQVIAEFNRSL